jgi:hypothetical protein
MHASIFACEIAWIVPLAPAEILWQIRFVQAFQVLDNGLCTQGSLPI